MVKCSADWKVTGEVIPQDADNMAPSLDGRSKIQEVIWREARPKRRQSNTLRRKVANASKGTGVGRGLSQTQDLPLTLTPVTFW